MKNRFFIDYWIFNLCSQALITATLHASTSTQ